MPVQREGVQLLRYDRVSATYPREPGGFREAPEFDSYLLRSFDLVDRVGDIRVLYISFVSGVVHDKHVVGKGIVYPFLQFVLSQGRSGRVIGIAEVKDVHPATGQIRYEVVFLRARDVYDIAPFPVFQYPGASAHYVRVDVGRIYGVCHPDTIVVAEHVTYISTIAFRSVADEYLARFDKDSPAGIIVLDDSVD